MFAFTYKECFIGNEVTRSLGLVLTLGDSRYINSLRVLTGISTV